jgi:RNA polymerase sigma-70 factor (ECF subfamily)
MSGRDEIDGVRAIVYCLVPRRLAPELFELLRRHFRDVASIEVIVEQRGADRRNARESRILSSPHTTPDRRRIRNPDGRRIRERRAVLVPVSIPELPRRAREVIDQLSFVERLEPVPQQTEDDDTARLVTRIQAGESDGFADLYLRYFDRVYGYMRSVFKQTHDAEDATQEVFVKALEALPNYERRRQPFRAWLFTIARNHAINHLQKLGRIEAAGLGDELPRDEPRHASPGSLRALDWITDREMQLFTDRLPLIQRQILFLRYGADLTSAEIATILGLSAENVRKHHVRAMQFVRDRMVALGRDPRTPSRRIGARLLPRKAAVVRLRRFSLVSPP